jgi:hypothetical protein
LGCDLIYYTPDYNAHVLVQYKRLAKPGVGPWEFRPSSDANFEKELKRMRAIAAPARVKDTPEHHRFGENFCFIKFCKATTNDPFSGELAPGMYLPLDYFDKLALAGRLKGPRGGTVVNYDNVGRWLNNSAFVGLVERAWVGTRGLTSTQLTTVIRRSLAAKHSLILPQATPCQRGHDGELLRALVVLGDVVVCALEQVSGRRQPILLERDADGLLDEANAFAAGLPVHERGLV